jgi:alanine racemase
MRTKAIIHLDNFIENINAVKARVGKKTLICVPVKADAYGHGAVEIAKTSIEAGVCCLGAAAITEGLELRKKGVNVPILLFSQPQPEEIPEILSASLIPFVSDISFVDALNKKAAAEGKKVPVHIKIDTGMRRLGCMPEEALSLAKHIRACSGLELAGVATHFAVSDSADDEDAAYTKQQIALFKEIVDSIKSAGIEPGIVHAANSGAVILHPDAWFDMVRPGILLYGYKTVEESGIADFPYEPIFVKPVMELRSVVVMIKSVKKGKTISYGRTWTAPKDTNIGILSAGYADGLPRLASGKWQAVVGGKTYPLAGRICMDQCMVDLGVDADVKRWDEAVIFGGEAEDADELAKRIGTIPYEITCNINKRVIRVYEK